MRHVRGRQLAAASLGGMLLMLAVAACGGSAPAQSRAAAAPSASSTGGNAALQALLKQARAEGEVDITMNANELGGQAGANQVAALIQKRYGVGLHVVFTPGPSMPVMTARLEQELRAGQPASTDIWIGDEGQLYTALHSPKPILRAEPWAQYSATLRALPSRVEHEMIVQNVAVEEYTNPPGIVYNTQLVPKSRVPRTMQDLLNPYWKGKIVSTPYAAGFSRLSAKGLWGPQKVLAFVHRFLGNVAGFAREGEPTEIASGQYPLMALTSVSGTLVLQRKGAPVAYTFPRDAANLSFVYIGVPENARHPAAAALFVKELLTPAGQALIWKAQGADDYELPGSHLAKVIQAATAGGIHFTRIDYAFVTRHKEPDRIRPQIVKLFRQVKS